MRILFVCTGNMDSSPTAEDLLKGRKGFEVLSAGTWIDAPRRISQSLIDWADKILVMQDQHKKAILELKPDVESKLEVLNVPDIYQRNDPELVKTLKAKLAEHLKIKW